MRKGLLMVVAAMTAVVMVAETSHAILRRDRDYIRGTVIEVNTQKNSVTIKDDSGVEREYVYDGGNVAGIEKGSRVLVVAVKGTNSATLIQPSTR